MDTDEKRKTEFNPKESERTDRVFAAVGDFMCGKLSGAKQRPGRRPKIENVGNPLFAGQRKASTANPVKSNFGEVGKNGQKRTNNSGKFYPELRQLE